MENTPLTHEQVKNLPKGFTPTAIYPNNRERRAKLNDNPHRMNNRKLTKGRTKYRNHHHGRVLPNLK